MPEIFWGGKFCSPKVPPLKLSSYIPMAWQGLWAPPLVPHTWVWLAALLSSFTLPLPECGFWASINATLQEAFPDGLTHASSELPLCLAQSSC